MYTIYNNNNNNTLPLFNAMLDRLCANNNMDNSKKQNNQTLKRRKNNNNKVYVSQRAGNTPPGRRTIILRHTTPQPTTNINKNSKKARVASYHAAPQPCASATYWLMDCMPTRPLHINHHWHYTHTHATNQHTFRVNGWLDFHWLFVKIGCLQHTQTQRVHTYDM